MRTEYYKIAKLFLGSCIKSWEGNTGTVNVTETEHRLLEQHGWTYQEFTKESERLLNEHMGKLEEGSKNLQKALKRINQ
jgi:hypothetical protein